MRRCLFSFSPRGLFFAFIIAGVFSCATCRAQVVINEVYYDHPGRDEGWEFIELYNGGAETRDLTGFTLESIDGATGRKTAVWSAPAGFMIAPEGYLCIAGAYRAPAPQLLLKGSFGNGPDAVRLLSAGMTVDLVGYGNLAFADLYEGSPAPLIEPGSSLARKPDGSDTDRNDVDFVPADPTPGKKNFCARDVALGIESRGLLPCRGAPFEIKVKLVNCGLEPFRSRVSILAEALCDGREAAEGRAELDLALHVAGSDSVRISLSPPAAAALDVRAWLSGAPDENPENNSSVVRLATSPGAVVINEIMYRPREGGSEWIELEGASGAPVNLKSWTICDATERRRVIAKEDVRLKTGEFLILAQDSAAFAAEHPGCHAPVRKLSGSWPSLNDTDSEGFAEAIEIFDSSGVLVERITYKNLLGSERGRSIERVSESACSGSPGGIWHRSADPSGSTPGQDNSIHGEPAPSASSLRVDPNPFCPRTARAAVISGSLRAGETGFRVRIFDMGGAEVRRIFAENGGAPSFSCRWDGRGNDGSPARTGLYVCLVEYVRTGGGVCRKEKTCIAVAAQ